MTATHHGTEKPHGHAAGTSTPQPHDPEHDIDAKATAIWVIASSIVLYLALYFLLPLFDLVMTQERQRKVNDLPTAEYNELAGSERAFLGGQGTPSKKSIEQVMKEMVK